MERVARYVVECSRTGSSNIPQVNKETHQKQSVGIVRIFTDASIKSSIMTRVGYVFMNENNEVVTAGCKCLNYSGSVIAMEVVAISIALNKVKELGYRNIVVNCDNSNRINALNGGETAYPIHELFIEDILMLKDEFTFCSFSFSPRGQNFIAHNLARFVDSFVGDNCWYFSFPNLVEHLFSPLGRGFIRFLSDLKKKKKKEVQCKICLT